MGLVSIAGKIVLVVVNILILLLSLAMVAIGVVIIAGKDVWNSLLDKFKDQLNESLTQMGLTVTTDNMSLSDLIQPVAYALIAIGVVIGTLALLGCIVGYCTIKIVLTVYVVALGAILLVQVTIAGIVYADKSAFDGVVKPHLRDTLDDFSGILGTEPKTLAWNALMNYEECCGVDSYRDFAGLSNWPPSTVAGQAADLSQGIMADGLGDINLNMTSNMTLNSTLNLTLMTPVICCKSKSINFTCALVGDATTSNNNMEVGCYGKLYDLIVKEPMVTTVLVLILAFQFVMLLIASWILCTMNSKIGFIL